MLAAVVVAAVTAFVVADGPPPLDLLKRPRTGEPRMDKDGDESDLPTRRPDALWLPLEFTPGLRLRTHVKIEGHDVAVILDTGAGDTILSGKVAHELGLDAPNVVRTPTKIKEATGVTMEAYVVDVGTIDIGERVHNVKVIVLPKEDAFEALLGYDVLEFVDLALYLDEGELGIFPPGKGKLTARDNVVRIVHHQSANVEAPLDDTGREAIPFTIDTGAPHSLIDADLGVQLKLPFDKRFAEEVFGAATQARASNGVYALDHLKLGREHVDVGPLRAPKGPAAINLLGVDVLMRHHTLLGTEHNELRIAPMPIRPATRTHGPDGKDCGDHPCIEAAIGERDGKPCVALAVDKAWGGKHVSALVDVLDGNGNSAVGGGFYVFRGDIPENGLALCGDPANVLPLYDVKKGAPVSLLRFHVVDKEAHECPKDTKTCMQILFTGPAAAPPAH